MQEQYEVRWKDYYAILQVHLIAEPEVIAAAYRKLAQKYHPDMASDPSASRRMAEINEAYEVLSHTARKARYDEFYRAKKAEEAPQYAGAQTRPDMRRPPRGEQEVYRAAGPVPRPTPSRPVPSKETAAPAPGRRWPIVGAVLGATLCAGAGFGVGLAWGLWARDMFGMSVYILGAIIVPVILGPVLMSTHDETDDLLGCSAAAFLILVWFFSIPFAVGLGVVTTGPPDYKWLGFKPAFSLILSIPPTLAGAIVGYSVARGFLAQAKR